MSFALSRHMIQHAIWATGLLGHVVLVAVLLFRGRARRFPFFTLLICFDIVRTLALRLVLWRLQAAPMRTGAHIFETVDLILEYAVLVELFLVALRPLDAPRRALMALLLVTSGVLALTRVAPLGHLWGGAAPGLLHFLLGILMVLWTVVLALLLPSLNLSWRSDVAVITFGFGLYSAVLLLAGGYFRVGRTMSDFLFFSYFRIGVYLLVVIWWIAGLWSAPRLSSGRKLWT
jgi:hypothetical protein